MFVEKDNDLCTRTRVRPRALRARRYFINHLFIIEKVKGK
jgi:hypothetical protein